MDFLGTPDVSTLMFFGLTAASFAAAFIGTYTAAAGGLMLLGLMATVMPPAALIPVHTVVMLGSGITRSLLMWQHIMRSTVLPFVIGATLGAALGARVFIALPTWSLQLILGLFMLVVTWMPKLGRIGGERGRFTVLGFGSTFLGVFVSATGSLLSPFIASAAPSRLALVATMGALMAYAHVAKLAAFAWVGLEIGSFIPLMIAMIAAGVVGNWLGEKALRRISEQRFRLMFKAILTALSLQLLWGAARGAGVF